MAENEKRAWWFYLIGCTPVTLVLLFVLLALMFVPFLFRGSPRVISHHGLPQLAEKRSWILVGGKWRWTEDVDADGRVDCFRRQGTMRDAFFVPEHKARCLHGVLGTLARMAGPRVLEEPLRAQLSAVHAFKFERRWTPLTTLDADGDGQVDCVAERSLNELLLRRGLTDCPFAAHSIPDPLENHDRLTEFQQLLELEDAARRTLVQTASQ